MARVYGDLGPVMHVPVGWLVVAVVAESAGFVAGWVRLRVALRADKRTTVIVPDLAGNAATNVLPAGAAIGAVVQLRMLSRFGVGLTRSVTALAASALLTTVAGLATFALLAVVSIMTGAAVSASTVEFAGASLVVAGRARARRVQERAPDGGVRTIVRVRHPAGASLPVPGESRRHDRAGARRDRCRLGRAQGHHRLGVDGANGGRLRRAVRGGAGSR
jgi:hypothetical protein